MHVAHRPVLTKLHVEHPFRHDSPLAGAGQARVLYGMFDEKEHAGSGAAGPLVHQHRAPFQQITVALQGQVDDRIQQRMSGADEGREGLARGCHQVFLEGNAFIAG